MLEINVNCDWFTGKGIGGGRIAEGQGIEVALLALVGGVNIDGEYRAEDFLPHQFVFGILHDYHCGLDEVTLAVVIVASCNHFTVFGSLFGVFVFSAIRENVLLL